MESVPEMAGSIRVLEKMEPVEASFCSGCRDKESRGILSELGMGWNREGRC